MEEWLFFDVMGPRGKAFMGDQKLADQALRDGRNPFCAQCHGPGGALDPNNEWNRRARAGSSLSAPSLLREPTNEDALRQWIMTQPR
jgi:hypothetical protein